MQVAWQGQTNNNLNHYVFNHEEKVLCLKDAQARNHNPEGK